MAAPTLSDTRFSLFTPLVVECGDRALSPAADGAWERVLGELLRLRKLPDDWDGQGSRALDPAHVDAAIRWIDDMRRCRQALPPTGVFPGTTGEVVLEWRGEVFHLAAEIASADRVEWLLNRPGEPIQQWQTDTRRTWIVRTDR